MSDLSEAERKKTKSGPSNLAIRVLTALVAVPTILWMLFGAPPWVFTALVLFGAGVGGSELAGMVFEGQRLLQVWVVLATLAVTSVLTLVPTAEALTALIFGLLLLGPLVALLRPRPLHRAGILMGWLIAGPLYIGGASAAIAKLHHLDVGGGTWVVLAMAFAWGSDTGGYFAGKAFGRHKLYELISPKKTIEGSIGGLLAVVLFGLVIRFLWLEELPVVHAIVLALVAGAIGQAGDLCVSLIKRSTGVKDSGFIVPGHGGLLDRIDALLFTASVTLLYAHWVLGIESTVPTL